MSSQAVLKRMDEIVDAFCKRNRFQTEPLTQGRARTAEAVWRHPPITPSKLWQLHCPS